MTSSQFRAELISKFHPACVEKIITKPGFDPNFVDPDTRESLFEIIVQGALKVQTQEYAAFAVQLVHRLKQMGGTKIAFALQLAKDIFELECVSLREGRFHPDQKVGLTQSIETLKQIIVALENKPRSSSVLAEK